MEENGKPRPPRKPGEGVRPPDNRGAPPAPPVTLAPPAPPQEPPTEPGAVSRLKILRGVLIGCVTVVGLLALGAALLNLLWYILFR
ncbi:MAG: hypothetical protein HYY96_09170 [Candidatus Tectomicrobia bacterium]|nr:hypothetical protein [Candidatus Tectomicrobia bacterium]